LAERPGRTDLPQGFLFFDTTFNIPLWLNDTNWVDATGATVAAASGFSLTTTAIEHGLGAPASGFIITNVQNAVIRDVPRIVPAGNSTDNNTVRIWLSYAPLSSVTPATADFYVYR
jgi:hypothetical protein